MKGENIRVYISVKIIKATTISTYFHHGVHNSTSDIKYLLHVYKKGWPNQKHQGNTTKHNGIWK